MTQINRRRALAVVAAVPAAVATGSLATGEPGELAALIRRYWAEIGFAFREDRSDEEVDALAEATFQKTLRQMIGVPARTAEDAIAALDFFVTDTKDCAVCLDNGGVYPSIIRAVRGYIATA